MGNELQIEFGGLYRRFALEIRNELIAEKRQQGGEQHREYGHHDHDAVFNGSLSFRLNHLSMDDEAFSILIPYHDSPAHI